MTKEQQVDDFVKQWTDLEVDKLDVTTREKKLLDEIVDLAETDKTTGTVTLKGSQFEVKLTLRENVRYERDRGQPHPLIDLVKRFKWLSEFINLDVREKGSKIKNMLLSFEEGACDEEADLVCREIQKIRTTASGKPGVAVSERTN